MVFLWASCDLLILTSSIPRSGIHRFADADFELNGSKVQLLHVLYWGVSEVAPNAEVPIVPPSDAKAGEWVTALCAAGFDFRLDHDADGWTIFLPADTAPAAREELNAFEADNRNWPPVAAPVPPPPPSTPASWSPAWVGGFLIAFYAWLGPYAATSPILQAAAMDAEAVQAGQWWRIVTALLVHADVGHLMGNVCCLLLLGRVACALFGSGLAWLLILGAGIAGNALEAWVFPGMRLAVGASTAGFGALGLLVAHRAVQRARHWHYAAPALREFGLPVIAGLMMLAILGSGPRSDLAAHALGMFSGACFGTALGATAIPRLPAWCQRALELLTLAIVMLAWRAAFTGTAGA